MKKSRLFIGVGIFTMTASTLLMTSGCPKGLQTAADFAQAAECILVDESEKHMTPEEIAADCGSKVEDVVRLLEAHEKAAALDSKASCPLHGDAGADASETD